MSREVAQGPTIQTTLLRVTSEKSLSYIQGVEQRHTRDVAMSVLFIVVSYSIDLVALPVSAYTTLDYCDQFLLPT